MSKQLPRIIRSWIWLWLVLIVPLGAKAQLISIGTVGSACAGQSLNISVLPGNTILGPITSALLTLSVASPAGITATVGGGNTLISVQTSSALATGTYDLTVVADALPAFDVLNAIPPLTLVVPVPITGLPVFSPSGPITGSLGSIVSLGTCPVGTVLNYVSGNGITGTGSSLSLVPALSGQSLSVVCTGTCSSTTSILNLPVLSSALNAVQLGPVCVGSPLSLSLIPTGIDLTSPLVTVGASGPVNTTVSAFNPATGVLTISGLSSGTTTLTVSVSVAGTQVASIPLPVSVLPLPATPTTPSTLTALLGSTLSLSGLCPVGTTLGLPGLPLLGSIPISTSALGVQSLSLLCSNGTCVGLPNLLSLSVVAPILNAITNAPLICTGQPLSLTVLPTNFGVPGAIGSLVSLSVTGPLGVSAGVIGPDGVISVSGLPAGGSNLTLTAYVAGNPVASIPIPVSVISLSAVTGLVTSQSVLQNTSLSLLGTCPVTGILSYTSSTGSSGTTTSGSGIPVNTGIVGAQSYTVVCLSPNGCISPITVANITVLGGGLTQNPGNPTQICLGQPLNLSLLGSGVLAGLPTGLVSLSLTGPAGVSASVLGPGLLQVTGLPSGASTLTVTAALAGTPVASIPIGINVLSLPVVQGLASLSGLTGSTINLVGTCPTGILSYTSSGGASGTTTSGSGIPVLTGSAGVQSYTVICLDANGCISPITVVNVTLLTGTLTPSDPVGPICLGSPLNLTLLPGGGLDLSLVSLSVTGVANIGVSGGGGPGVLTITNLPAGNQLLTVTAYLLGQPVATVNIPVTILSVQPPSVASSPGLGQTYPAGQTSVTVIQNQNNPVQFFASCSGGSSVSYTGSNGATGSSNFILVSTTATGTYTYSVVCRNGSCVSPATVVNVIVSTPANQPPTVAVGGIPSPQSGTVGVAFTSNVGQYFSDPDGNTLTFSQTGLPAGLSISAGGVISGTPTVAGTSTVVVTANDGQGGIVSSSFVLNILPAPNQPPRLVGTGIPTPQSGTVTIGFSFTTGQYFNDPEGGALLFSFTGTLPPGLSFAPGTGVISGTPTVAGTYNLTITATDNQAASISDDLQINISPAPNRPPTTGTIPSPQSGTVGIGFTSTVSTAFSDPDGSTLSFGQTGLPAGLSISTGGVISGTPTQSGSFPVIVTATDPQGASVSAGFTLNISPANQAPTVIGTLTSPQFATVNTTFLTNTAQVFNDPEGGPLSFSATGLPTGVGINSGNGIISGTPSVTGTFPITVTARDPQGASASASFTLIVVPQAVTNQPPQLTGVPLASPQSGTVGMLFTTTTAGAFVDPNGGPLTFSATGLPNGVTINPTTGVISGTPTQSGSFVVVVTATDPQLANVSTGFILNVAPVNQPPTVVGGGLASPQTTTVNMAFVTPTAYAFNDPEGGALTFSASGLPAGLGIDPSSGIISGAASVTGTFNVTVRVSDPQGLTTSSGFVLFVLPQTATNQPPQVVGTLTNPQFATVNSAFTSPTASAFFDVDPLTYTATGLPAGLSINPSTGVISGAPSVSGSFGVVVTARDPQSASASAGFTLIVSPQGVTTQPLAVTVVSYNCATGAIVFGRIGGDPNRPVEFLSIGVTGWTTNPNNLIPAEVRNDPNQNSITVFARYVNDQNSTVSYVFNFRAYCQNQGNNPPVYNGSLTNQVGTVGTPFTYTFPSNAFTDPEGGALTYSATGLPPGLSLSGQTISGTPSLSGTYGVTILAQDPQGASQTGSFLITINPATVVGPPLAATVLSYNCQTGDIVFGRVGGDPNRVVEYMAIGVRGFSTNPNARIEAELRNDQNQSTITVMARYVSDPSSIVTYTFNFRAGCAPTTNLPPVYNGGIPNLVGTVGVPFSYTIPATAFSDPESQTIRYGAAGLPPGVSLIGRVITGTPTQQGFYSPVYIFAFDPQNNFAQAIITFTVNPATPGNQPPILTGTIPNQTATVGILYTYTIPTNVFTDPEGQTLTFSINGHPRRLEINGRTISGFPLINGVYQITVTATDPGGQSASTSYLLTVLPNNTCGSDPATIGQPLQLLQPDYNCQTGVIKFNITGGNGGPVTYAAIGITVPTQDCFDQMDTEVSQDVRNDKPNVEPFQIRAIQNGVFVQYSFDARAYCRNRAGGREGITGPALDVTVLGNPTNSDAVEVEVRGAEGHPLRLRVADPMGAAISEQQVEQAGSVERVRIKLSGSTGVYLLQVNTPTTTKVVKIVRQ